MTMPADAIAPPTAPTHAVRPFYWSLRRELWENRSIWVGPTAAAGVIVFGVLLSLFRFAHRFEQTASLSPMAQLGVHLAPYGIAAVVVMLASIVVGVFYCLGALNSERRDRSILFWKSLPVSDLVTVLAKLAVPMAVLPAVAFVIILATQLITMTLSVAVLAGNGLDPSPLLRAVPLGTMTVVLLYGLVTMALWYAPIWGWLLLVSAWAKRVAFLWAFGAPFALCVVELIAFHSHHVLKFLGWRFAGNLEAAFRITTLQGHTVTLSKLDPVITLSMLDPVGFLASPGLWLGLVFAAACIAGAVWMRRRREPI